MGKNVSKQVAVRTFSDGEEPAPGYLEMDFVAHCGGVLTGVYIHSLVATDVCSGGPEAVPLLAREQSLVVEGIEAMGRQFPVAIVGIDTDDDSAFINESPRLYGAISRNNSTPPPKILLVIGSITERVGIIAARFCAISNYRWR